MAAPRLATRSFHLQALLSSVAPVDPALNLVTGVLVRTSEPELTTHCCPRKGTTMDARRLRKKAEHSLWLAQQLADEKAVAALEKLAANYIHQAQTIETIERQEQP
jgi:hypothetical protein